MTKANGGGLSASPPVEPEPTIDPTPTLMSVEEIEERFIPYSLDQFQVTRALWAANYFVLWPLGLALTVDVATDEATGFKTVSNLHVREWTYEPGEAETIDMTKAENNEYYQEFLSFVRERVLNMKVEERQAALARLTQNGPLSDPAQLLIAR